MSDISSTIQHLQAQRTKAEQEVAALTEAINALTSLSTGKAPAFAKATKKGGMSAAGRARIAAAQKARWAKIKAAKPAKKKYKISAEGRAKIIAAQKARWAKIMAGKTSKAE